MTEQEYAANILRIVRDGLDGLIHTMFVADTGRNPTIQGSTNRRAPGCVNAAGKLRQKW